MKLIPQHVKDTIINNLMNKQTPYYLLDIDQISNKYFEILNGWRKFFSNTLIAYSYKTNSLSTLTEILRTLGSGAEVVSGLELFNALEDKIEPLNIYFNGSVKEKSDLEIALKNNVNILIDSVDEFELLMNLVIDMKIEPRIIPRMAVDTKNMTTSRFGLTLDEYYYICRILNQHGFKCKGLHFHVGSNNNSPQKYLDALYKFESLIDDLLKNTTENITLDIGGGFASNSSYENLIPIQSEKFANELYDYFKYSNIDTNRINIVIEPGRSLVEDYGYLITKVKVKKKRDEKNLLFTDAGSHLIHSNKSRYHPVEFVENMSEETKKYDVYGLNCFEYDILKKDLCGFSDVKVNDLLVIGYVGGYDIPLEASWTQPKPAIWAIYNKSCSLIRAAQQYSDVRPRHISLLNKDIENC